MSERTIFECEAGAVTIEYGKAHFYQAPNKDNIYTTAIERLEELQQENARLRAKYDKLREQVDRRGLGIND